jgi:hypothetical protein
MCLLDLELGCQLGPVLVVGFKEAQGREETLSVYTEQQEFSGVTVLLLELLYYTPAQMWW